MSKCSKVFIGILRYFKHWKLHQIHQGHDLMQVYVIILELQKTKVKDYSKIYLKHLKLYDFYFQNFCSYRTIA
jgi:hypothetical protein